MRHHMRNNAREMFVDTFLAQYMMKVWDNRMNFLDNGMKVLDNMMKVQDNNMKVQDSN